MRLMKRAEKASHWRPAVYTTLFSQLISTSPIPRLRLSGQTAFAEILAEKQTNAGLARTTDSLCPNCVIEARNRF